LLKEKRPKKVGYAAVPKKVEREITYEELFKSVEPVQCIIPSEQGPAEESGLLPSWNPFMESVGPDSLQEVVDDPFADVWNDMRLALESGNNVSNVTVLFEKPEFLFRSTLVIFFFSFLYINMDVTVVWMGMLVRSSRISDAATYAIPGL
jgi:hypothetical protein